MTYDLRRPASEAEWAVYHEIRRRILFELRGRGDTYDPQHPDDLRPTNHPLVLWRDAEALGVIRVDIATGAAIFRRVAVREDVQRQGHGRQLLARAERFARMHGCTRIDSHVDLDAVGFYERCGFSIADTAKRNAATVFMTKDLGGTSMDESSRRRSPGSVILLGVVYFVVGIVLGVLAAGASSNAIREAWRRAAWVISAIAFAAHIAYLHFRLRFASATTALHAALGPALGSFGLAVAANIHALTAGSTHKLALALSLVLWPLLTAVPAFLVALGVAALLALRRRDV